MIAILRRRIPRLSRVVACLPRPVSIVRAAYAVSGRHLPIVPPSTPPGSTARGHPTPADRLAAPAPDTPVTAPEPAKPAPPTVVAPPVLARAREEAQQYRTEHGTPITPGQLAVRLKVTSDQAAQALAVLNLAADSPTRQVQTVNGHRPQRTVR